MTYLAKGPNLTARWILRSVRYPEPMTPRREVSCSARSTVQTAVIPAASTREPGPWIPEPYWASDHCSVLAAMAEPKSLARELVRSTAVAGAPEQSVARLSVREVPVAQSSQAPGVQEPVRVVALAAAVRLAEGPAVQAVPRPVAEQALAREPALVPAREPGLVQEGPGPEAHQRR